MMVSPPASPDGERTRSQSAQLQPSPDHATKQRPQSAFTRPTRSSSRLSQSSSIIKAGTRLSDDDSKTSVRVVVRVRPPLGPSDPGYDLIPQRFQKSMVHVTTATSLGVESPQGRKVFIFDRVFDSDITQRGVWDYLQDSVDSFLQGYNVSILAYGQSGSGKSFTMGTSGPTQQFDPSSKGVIPRAAEHLFESLNNGTSSSASHNRTSSGLKTPSKVSVASLNSANTRVGGSSDKDWEMSVTYVEIYNEQPRDLLLPEATPINERPMVQIREDTKGRILVEGLKSVPVTSIEELMAVLNHGSSIRQTDATAINSKSSRSHAVFTINLRQHKLASAISGFKDKKISAAENALNGETQITVESKLHFVDLAGSERLKNTGATGDRAKEGISINAGLASLGKVISQLSSRVGGGHVSYRDSKLTRILQDSLGGNAITYMVACVTPAEFHLSETLNTVQYAQRARNIQSKPKIQPINDDADKQAVIERLKSEVAFLRQQIRSAETGDRHTSTGHPHEREVELHNQLLDIQENYNALSQRHAKLISEFTKPDHFNQDNQQATGDNAGERLKRSQEHQQQIEQVVLEYEKTIQSLENNLQTTRGSLAATESSLLEKETKCAYIETMNQQLNSRIQKGMEREANTESYLRDLEARLEDQSSGEEKHNAIIAELRKELTRIRENETSAEDYICTLEERLAEADQDMEILQREVERLEQLVERQRSLGKLDNLLSEIDKHQKRSSKVAVRDRQALSTDSSDKQQADGKTQKTLEALDEAEETEGSAQGGASLISEAHEREKALDQLEGSAGGAGLIGSKVAYTQSKSTAIDEPQPSPAQQKFVAEKFESVSQELFDLRIEHESTVNEYDLLSAKYQEALRTLAEMQDSYDELRHQPSRSAQSADFDSRPESMSVDAKDHDISSVVRPGVSRSLSSELSVAGESPDTPEPHEVTALPQESGSHESKLVSDTAGPDVERLQLLVAKHERGMKDVSDRYSQLRLEHDEALRTVEKLKADMRSNYQREPGSPRTTSPGLHTPNMPGMIRRMTSNINSGVDRGQRTIVTLRTFLAEEFEEKPDSLETAEVHLTAAGHELSTRMERISILEGEMKNLKKEMDNKTTIIAGLTRERSSMRAGTPADLSMVSQMRDQLIQKETELKSLHDGYAKREVELQSEIERLSSENKSRESTPDPDVAAKSDEKLRSLKAELSTAEKRLTVTAAELEAARANFLALRQQPSPLEEKSQEGSLQPPVDLRFTDYEAAVAKLKEHLEIQEAANITNTQKISELTKSHAAANKDVREHQQAIKARSAEIEKHKARIVELDSQIKDVQSQVEFHKHGLKSLHQSHAAEVEEMKLSHAGMLASYDDKFEEMESEHQKQLKQLNTEVENTKGAMNLIVNGAQQVLGHPTSHEDVVNHIQDLVEEKESIARNRARLLETNAELERQLNGRQSLMELEENVANNEKKIQNYQETIRSLANEVGNHEETIREKETIIKKHEATIADITQENQKKIAFIEELETQLQSTFAQSQGRVSLMQQQGQQALTEAHQRISALEREVQRSSVVSEEAGSRTNTMKSQHRPQSPPGVEKTQRSDSLTSNLRKSASIASLPSPPPAIPLPPLPTLPGISLAQSTANPSPPQSRHTSKEVTLAPGMVNGNTTNPPPSSSSNKDSTTIKRQSAIIEDQESRLRTMEKHLHAEKQLTATLEEALVDLETQSNKLRVDAEGWKKKAWAMEEELASARKERRSERLSVQAVEEEVKKRREAEAARAQLEERMRLLQGSGEGKKKKKSAGLNCF